MLTWHVLDENVLNANILDTPDTNDVQWEYALDATMSNVNMLDNVEIGMCSI